MKTIDLTPSWEASAQLLLLAIHGDNASNAQWAESEVIRMGRIIDHLTVDSTPEPVHVDTFTNGKGWN